VFRRLADDQDLLYTIVQKCIDFYSRYFEYTSGKEGGNLELHLALFCRACSNWIEEGQLSLTWVAAHASASAAAAIAAAEGEAVVPAAAATAEAEGSWLLQEHLEFLEAGNLA